ncbi:unnamed protein product [Paramecium sonneborni]|uniref:Uncharacterized protein n=1 Tax=Paramecium sonneborni TaxID=65129 RepID=A0A8S1QRD0_9CILI|nr:unnamed protein product [Paramecium sonneborni]
MNFNHKFTIKDQSLFEKINQLQTRFLDYLQKLSDLKLIQQDFQKQRNLELDIVFKCEKTIVAFVILISLQKQNPNQFFIQMNLMLLLMKTLEIKQLKQFKIYKKDLNSQLLHLDLNQQIGIMIW